MQKKLESKLKNLGLKKPYFWGHPVIHTVEAKCLDLFTKKSYFYKIFRPEKNQPFLSTAEWSQATQAGGCRK